MKLNEMKQVDENQLSKIQPGFAFTTLVASLPLLVNAIAPIVGLIKTSMSQQGEIKDKNISFKWDDSESPKKTNTLSNYLTF